MNKKILIVLAVIVIIGVIAYSSPKQDVTENEPSVETQVKENSFNGENAAFTMDGKTITLINGTSETAVENSSAKVTTQYFGKETTGDLNGDGLEDRAFFVTQNMGGSGTFYYVVVALKNETGYKTTNAFLVGDRITPQSIEIRSDAKELHVNYADRKEGESMTVQPSQDKVLLLKVTSNGTLEGLMR